MASIVPVFLNRNFPFLFRLGLPLVLRLPGLHIIYRLFHYDREEQASEKSQAIVHNYNYTNRF
jgi:hypothetical protein